MIFEFNGFKPVIHKSAFIHPQANVTGNGFIGKDVYIGPFCTIRGDFGKIIRTIAKNTIINKEIYNKKS